jgi:hypothetical protein
MICRSRKYRNSIGFICSLILWFQTDYIVSFVHGVSIDYNYKSESKKLLQTLKLILKTDDFNQKIDSLIKKASLKPALKKPNPPDDTIIDPQFFQELVDLTSNIAGNLLTDHKIEYSGKLEDNIDKKIKCVNCSDTKNKDDSNKHIKDKKKFEKDKQAFEKNKKYFTE